MKLTNSELKKLETLANKFVVGVTPSGAYSRVILKHDMRGRLHLQTCVSINLVCDCMTVEESLAHNETLVKRQNCIKTIVKNHVRSIQNTLETAIKEFKT